MMDSGDRFDLARRRAAAYAPPPPCEPFTAGLIGAAAAGFPLAIFAGLSRINIDAAPFALLVTLGIAFGLPYFVVKAQQDRHSAAVSKEFEALRSELSTDQ